MSAPPASTAETTGATPRSAAASAAASAASLAPSWVRAGTSVVEKSAAAPAVEHDSSSSGVSPLVPIAPTTSPSTVSGIPPVSAEASVRHLLLDLPARADEDRRGAGLVDSHARAGDLRPLGASHPDQLA